MTHILGIETSCDETAAAVVQDGKIILSNVIASQIDLHAEFGGVFPELASRAHIEAIGAVVEQAINDSGLTYDQLDAIAVTRGPGLVGSLLVGINYAKGLALASGKPLLGINHLEGHVYSLWLTEQNRTIEFPVLILIVSGGHTELLLMHDHGQYERLGGTLDDAAGEAFDKIGRLLGLPFPGGPNIERAAQMGNPTAYRLPRPKRDTSLDFSFSGLKTAVMREVTVMPSANARRQRGAEKKAQLRDGISINDIAASFQAALVDSLVEKTALAAQAHGVTEIMLAGGVSANQALRKAMRKEADLPVRYPPLNLCTDNGAMIAAAAHYRYLAGLRSDWDLDVLPMWPLTNDAYAEA
jgi:N6-L-threonylcarbamoyladenine synthase